MVYLRKRIDKRKQKGTEGYLRAHSNKENDLKQCFKHYKYNNSTLHYTGNLRLPQ